MNTAGPPPDATLEYARRCDAADVLRDYRRRFALPTDSRGQPLVYLAGQSLGLMPLAARQRVAQELDDWASLGVHGHEHAHRPWIPYHENLAEGLAELAGAEVSEVVAMNSLTVNLHLMLAAFYRPCGARTQILMEAAAFPSDRHAVVSQIEWHGFDAQRHLIELAPAPGADLIDVERIESTLERHGSQIALVLWPAVQYWSGQAFDLARIARAAQRAGAVIGFDLAHAIGNIPLALHDSGADFAIWCSYKYLNAGPGAIGGCFVHARHDREPRRPHLAGWWGHDPATRFLMSPQFKAAPGASGWQVSNPPVLAAAPLIASLELFHEARMERLRAKSLALTGFLEHLLDRLHPSVHIVTPREPQARGCQLSLRVEHGRAVFERLTAAGVACDWREPDVIRVAPVPLYSSFEEVFRFSERLALAMSKTS